MKKKLFDQLISSVREGAAILKNMKRPSRIFEVTEGVRTESDLEQKVERYKQIRQTGRQINSEMCKQVSKEILHRGARNLGMLSASNVIVLNTEGEADVLMDHCLYDIREKGMNLIERLLKESPPPESDRMIVLQSMAQARYTLIVTEEAVEGAGLWVQDVFAQEKKFMFDISLSYTARPGHIGAMRVKEPEGFFMSTGVGLPIVNPKLMKDVQDFIARTVRRHKIDSPASMTPQQNAELATGILRLCVRYDASSSVAHGDPPAPGADIDEWYATQTQSRAAGSPVERIARNAPCPCGSGSLYKRCCGRGRG
jgi:hypothetical protein